MEQKSYMIDQVLEASLRRSSRSNEQGKSRFYGVVRNDSTGIWQIRQGPAGKDYFMGNFGTEEAAAIAFDIASVKQKGYRAITNYDLRCYDVEAILKAQKLQNHQMGVETTKPSVTQEQNNNLRMIDSMTGIGSWNSTVPTPTITNLSLGHQQPKKVVPKNLSWYRWAVEIIRKAEKASPNVSNFRHGTFSPFLSYSGRYRLKDHNETSSFGFRHASSNAFKYLKHRGDSNSSNGWRRQSPLWSMPPYQVNWEQEQWLKARGLGFKHASRSCFKSYVNKCEGKGKEKMNPDA